MSSEALGILSQDVTKWMSKSCIQDIISVHMLSMAAGAVAGQHCPDFVENKVSKLEQLHGFLVVSETLSVSAAARKMGISQPALTRRLQQLEHQLGAKLLIRRKHGIDLTEAGRRLAGELGPIFTALDERMGALSERKQMRTRSITIGSLAEIGRSYVYPRLLNVVQQQRQCRFDVQLLGGQDILRGVVEGTIDLGVVVDVPNSRELIAQPLFEERSILVTRSGNTRDITTAGEALSSQFVAYRKGDPLLSGLLSQMMPRAAAERVLPRFTINDHRVVLDLLLATESYAVMPLHAISGSLESGTLRKAAPQQLVNTVWGIRLKSSKNELVRTVLTQLQRKS